MTSGGNRKPVISGAEPQLRWHKAGVGGLGAKPQIELRGAFVVPPGRGPSPED